MEVTAFHKEVLTGKVCPYCGSGTKLIAPDATHTQFNTNDFVVACRKYPICRSYTMAWPNSTKPYGRLGHFSLHIKRDRAMKQFIKLYRDDLSLKDALYQEMAEELGVPLEYAELCYYNEDNLVKAESWAIRKGLALEYEQTKVYRNMSSRREIDGKLKFKRCIIIEQLSANETLIEFDDGFRMVSRQVRITKS